MVIVMVMDVKPVFRPNDDGDHFGDGGDDCFDGEGRNSTCGHFEQRKPRRRM